MGASLTDDITDRQRMDSRLFTFRNHCSINGDQPTTMWNFETATPLNGWKYLGWCPSASAAIPEINWGGDHPIAVMLVNDQGAEAWLHVTATPQLVAAGYRGSK